MRLYRFPKDRLHILDGGIEAWRRAGQPTTTEVPEPDLADGLRRPVELGERDDSLIATYEEVVAWSREAVDGTRRADAASSTSGRRASSWARICEPVGAATSRAPGSDCFSDLLTDDGTFRPVDEMLSLVRASGADPAEIRATYCQGGVRAALAWFVLHELAGFDGVRSYAGSWEEWGNRGDSPIEAP